MKVLYAGDPAQWSRYEPALRAAFAKRGLVAELSPDVPPEQADYVIYAPSSGLSDFAPFTRARAVLGLWAGVERIVGNASLTQPLTRMVDPGLTEGMVEWVTGQVLRHHLGIDPWVRKVRGWRQIVPPLARNRSVVVLGLGELGGAVARMLASLNFQVTGWARHPHVIDGVTCVSGPVEDILPKAEILVLLLPNTPATEDLLNAERLALLPKGAVIINAGRGALIDEGALLAALDAGQVGHATLDVFRVEPLPSDHDFWSHPKVTVSPHIAAETRPESASEVIAENIRRDQAGEPLLHLVDRSAGY